jgi:hypothetical protein
VSIDIFDNCAVEVGPRAIIAHHEAGHAVAAVMRGGGELMSITIEPTDDHLGYTETRVRDTPTTAGPGTPRAGAPYLVAQEPVDCRLIPLRYEGKPGAKGARS